MSWLVNLLGLGTRVAPESLSSLLIAVGLATIVASRSWARAVILGAILNVVQPRTRWLMLVALAGFIASSAANSKPWFRYFDPFVVFWIVIAIADVYLASGRRPRLSQAWPRLVGPMLLALIFAIKSGYRLL